MTHMLLLAEKGSVQYFPCGAKTTYDQNLWHPDKCRTMSDFYMDMVCSNGKDTHCLRCWEYHQTFCDTNGYNYDRKRQEDREDRGDQETFRELLEQRREKKQFKFKGVGNEFKR